MSNSKNHILLCGYCLVELVSMVDLDENIVSVTKHVCATRKYACIFCGKCVVDEAYMLLLDASGMVKILSIYSKMYEVIKPKDKTGRYIHSTSLSASEKVGFIKSNYYSHFDINITEIHGLLKEIIQRMCIKNGITYNENICDKIIDNKFDDDTKRLIITAWARPKMDYIMILFRKYLQEVGAKYVYDSMMDKKSAELGVNCGYGNKYVGLFIV